MKRWRPTFYGATNDNMSDESQNHVSQEKNIVSTSETSLFSTVLTFGLPSFQSNILTEDERNIAKAQVAAFPGYFSTSHEEWAEAVARAEAWP